MHLVRRVVQVICRIVHLVHRVVHVIGTIARVSVSVVELIQAITCVAGRIRDEFAPEAEVSDRKTEDSEWEA